MTLEDFQERQIERLQKEHVYKRSLKIQTKRVKLLKGRQKIEGKNKFKNS